MDVVSPLPLPTNYRKPTFLVTILSASSSETLVCTSRTIEVQVRSVSVWCILRVLTTALKTEVASSSETLVYVPKAWRGGAFKV
jgi:hypothetical protein